MIRLLSTAIPAPRWTRPWAPAIGGLLAAVVPLTGCAASNARPTAPVGSASVSVSQATSPTAVRTHTDTRSDTPTGAPAAVPVRVRRTGGLAGVDQLLVVRPDGQWRWDAGTRAGGTSVGRLNAAVRRDLAQLAAALSVPTPSHRGPGAPRCMDGFSYRLVVGHSTRIWHDCGGGAPDTARRIVALLAESTPL